jgi:hypothetical protein
VEDLHEALVGAVPGIRFGLAFCEASGKRLVRWSGNDESALTLARGNALAIGAGHAFLIFLGDGFYRLGLAIDKVDVVHGDTSRIPLSFGSAPPAVEASAHYACSEINNCVTFRQNRLIRGGYCGAVCCRKTINFGFLRMFVRLIIDEAAQGSFVQSTTGGEILMSDC